MRIEKLRTHAGDHTLQEQDEDQAKEQRRKKRFECSTVLEATELTQRKRPCQEGMTPGENYRAVRYKIARC